MTCHCNYGYAPCSQYSDWDRGWTTEEYVVRTPVGVIYLLLGGGAFRSAVGIGRRFFGSKAVGV